MCFLQFLDTRSIPYECNVSLAQKSWIKTGGICTYWIVPQSVQQLIEVCRYLFTNNMNFDIVGQTSNIYFHSTYTPHVVVSTIKINHYTQIDEYVTCECGVSVIKLAKEFLSKGYAGFYGLVGLPGTVGSAVVNNASCFDCSVSSLLVSADVLLPDGTIQTLGKKDFAYVHRSSVFKRGEKQGIILSVKLKIQKANNVEEEYKKSEETVAYRREKQERSGRNLGSIFCERKKKHNMQNRLVYYISHYMIKMRLLHNQHKVEKCLLLFLYGYNDLKYYISDRNINTFIWKDEKAEEKFIRYKKFMSEVYENLVLEVEERI